MKQNYIQKTVITYTRIKALLFASVLVLAYAITNTQATPLVEAAIPKYINFQGKLTNVSNGTNVANGNYTFEFKLYDAPTGGTLLWTETWDGSPSPDCDELAVTNGVFNAKLGACNSLASVDFSGGDIYLTVNFDDGGGFDGEMTPRKQLVSSAFAFVANSVVGDGVVNTENQSTSALSIGRTLTNPALQVDTNTASSATGLKVTAAAAGGGAALEVISSGTNENLTLNAKGSGTISIGNTSTGNVLFGSSGQLSITNSGTLSTSGNISTTGSGAITSAGLLTGSLGLTVSGAAVSLNNSSNFDTNINTGTSTGTVTIGNSASTAVRVGNLTTNGVVYTSGANGTLNVEAQLSVARGGTGASTSQGAINAISQLTTNGDLLYHNGTNSTRIARGADGQCLTSTTTTIQWGGCGLSSVALHQLTAATTTNTIDNAGHTQTWNWNSLTTGNGFVLGTSSLTSGNLLSLSSTSTAAASNSQTVLRVATSGANATSTQTTYGGYFTNTHTGTASTNVAAYFSASGGTNNYAAIFDNGFIGIGDTTPESVLDINGPSAGDHGEVVGIKSTSTFGVDIGSAIALGGEYGVGNTFWSGIKGAKENVTSGNFAGYLSFYTRANSASLDFGSPNTGEVARFTSAGSMGIGTTAPDRRLEINSATGNNLRLTYNDADGSATNYADLLMSSGGDLTITPSGGDTNITGNLIVSSLTSGGTQCLQANSSGVISGTGSACGSNQTPWTSDIDADGYDLRDLSNLEFQGTTGAPAGSVVAIFSDNTGDLNLNALSTKTVNLQVNGTDEYNFSSTALAMNGNNITGLGTALTAAAGLTVTATAADLALVTATSGNITLAPASTGSVQVTSGVTTGTGTSSALSLAANSLTGGNALNVGSSSITSGTLLFLNGSTSLTTGNLLRTAATYVPGAGQVGSAVDIVASNLASNTSGVSRVTGLSVRLTSLAAGSGGTQDTYGIRLDDLGGFAGAGTQNNYGVRIGNYGKTDAELTYGLYVDPQTGSASNYAAYFGGSVGIANTTPSALLTLGTAGSTSGTLSMAGSTSGTITIQPQAAAGTYNFNLPTTAGTSGYLLTSGGGGGTAMTWTDPAGLGVRWNALTAPTGNLSLAMAGNTTEFTFNGVTTGNAFTMSSSSLSSGSLLNLAVTGTAAASNTQRALNVSTSGANATSTQTTYGGYFSNTHTGTDSTNIGLYATATGGTNNYAAIFEDGVVGIGTATPATTDKLTVSYTSTLDSNQNGVNIAPTYNTTFTGTTRFMRTLRVAPVFTGTTNTTVFSAYGADFTPSFTGATGGGAQSLNLVGLQANPSFSGTISSGSNSVRLYGGIFSATSDLGTTGTTEKYGQQISVSGTADTHKGIDLSVSGATTNIGIELSGVTSAAGNYAIYSDATAQSYFAGNMGIGIATPGAKLEIAGNSSSSAWGLNGIQLQASAGTYTDSSTAASGTATNAVFNSFAVPTLAATNTSVTTTNAATLYVAGAPTAGTNQTITNAYALWVDDGTSRFDGNVTTGAYLAIGGESVGTGNNRLNLSVGDSIAWANGSVLTNNGSLTILQASGGTDIDLRNGSGSSNLYIDSNATGNIGIGTTGPDRALEINSATGNNLRLTYNDNNGSATNYADLLMSSGGDLTITPSGGDTNITGNLIVSSLTSGGTQCLQANSSGVISGTGSACGTGGGFSGEVDDTTNDALTFTSDDASPPAGTVNSIFRDNAGDLNINTISGKTLNLQIAGTDEYNFSSTALAMNGNNITGLGTDITASGALTIASTSAALTLQTNTSGNIVLNSTGGTIELQDATNVTGALDVSTTLAVGTADAFTVNSSGAITAVTGITNTGALSTTVQSATALTVVRSGTDYALQVDTNTASSTTGLKITAAAAGSGVALAAISSGTNEFLTLDAKGSGEIRIGGVSTGNVLLAGGDTTTGCTVYNSSGNVICSGNIASGAANNRVGHWVNTGTVISPATGGHSLSVPGAGTDSLKLGSTATASGAGGIGIGTGATASGDDTVAIGINSQSRVDSVAIGSNAFMSSAVTDAVAIGYTATVEGVSSIAIGSGAYTASASSIILGREALGTSANQFVAGSSSYAINNIYFGKGVTDASPTAYTINGTGGSGTDIAGAAINIAGGRGTGTGNGGNLLLQVAYPTTTGSSLNSLTTVATFNADNNDASGTQNLISLTPIVNQSGTAGYTSLLVNTTETATGSGSKRLLDLQVGGNSRAYFLNTGQLNVNSVIAAGTSVRISRTDQGDVADSNSVVLTYNTNNRLVVTDHTAALGLVQASGIGSYGGGNAGWVFNGGTTYTLDNLGIGLTSATSLLHIQQFADSTNTSTPIALDVNSVGAAGELTASSGIQTFARIAPVINQSSTAGYTGLLINSTQTATGSGAKLLQDWQVGGVSKVAIDNAGALTALAGNLGVARSGQGTDRAAASLFAYFGYNSSGNVAFTTGAGYTGTVLPIQTTAIISNAHSATAINMGQQDIEYTTLNINNNSNQVFHVFDVSGTTVTGASARLLAVENNGTEVFGIDKDGGIQSDALISGGTQCLQANSSGVISGTGSACGTGGGFSGEVDDTTNDALTFTSDDASPPAGTVNSIFRDNAGDLNINTISGKTLNLQIAGTDEYNFSSTALAMNGNNITGIGTTLSAAAGLTIGTTSADLALQTTTSGNITMAPASTGSVQITSGVTTGTGTSSALSVVANSVNSGVGFNLSTTALTSGSSQRITGSGATMTTGGELIDLVLGANTVGAGLTVTSTGTYTGTGAADGLINIVANSLTTGHGSKMSFTGLTSGTGLLITGGSAMTTNGELIDLNMGAATAGNGINIATTGVYTGTGLAVLTADSATSGVGQAISMTGLTTGSALRVTGGSALNASGELVDLVMGAATVGAGLNITGTGTYTGSGFAQISSTGITSGSLLNLGQSTSTFTGNGLLMNMANGSGSFTGNFANFQVNGTTRLSVGSGTVTTSGATAIAGIFQDLVMNNSTASGFQFGNRLLNTVSSSTAGTHVGQFIRMTDNTSLSSGQVVRGLEVQAYSGTNNNGINTGIASFGKTFGIQAETSAQAGAVSQPAAVFAYLNQVAGQEDVGNAIRAYSDTIEDSILVSLYQEDSAFVGDGLVLNFGNGTGSFSGNFADFQVGGSSRFSVNSSGIVNLNLNATATTNGLCHSGADVDAATDTQRDVVACSAAPGDIAEWYETKPGVEAGDIVSVTNENFVYTEKNFNAFTGEETGTTSIHTISVLKRSNIPYDNTMVGIVSTSPYQTFGKAVKDGGAQNPQPVALKGRVLVKVTNENGAIQPGDYITTSGTQPGKGMKAINPGMVIGQAISSDDGTGKVMVFVQPFFFDPGLQIDNYGNVVLQRGTATTSIIANTQANAAYMIKQEGSGDILQLQSDGIDRLIVANNGSMSLNTTPVDDADLILNVMAADTSKFSINARGDLAVSGVIVIREDSFAGSIITEEDGLAEITFAYHLGTGKPVIQLTAEAQLPVFAQIVEFKTDDDGNYTGFVIKTFDLISAPVQAIVHYTVFAKQDGYETFGTFSEPEDEFEFLVIDGGEVVGDSGDGEGDLGSGSGEVTGGTDGGEEPPPAVWESGGGEAIGGGGSEG